MKFLTQLSDTASATLLRFPFVLLSAVVATAAAIYATTVDRAINGVYAEPNFLIIKAGLLAGLGISLLLSLALMAERRIIAIKSWQAQLIGVLILSVYFFALPSSSGYFSMYWVIQLTMVALASHLLVSFAPFLGKMNLNGFWHYNEHFFIIILTTLLYSYVLYGGLVLAMVSLKFLFKIDIAWQNFWCLFWLLQGVFNTWFFLSKIPADIGDFNTQDSYPKGLKVFSQYVLLPLVIIYLFILYAYGFKIIATWSLPVGWVSYMVLGFSVAGMLSFLLLYPFKNSSENGWIQQFNRWFYVIIVPLVGLLFVAVGYRIRAYGVTENRYFVVLLAIWLLGIALYFIFFKRDNISVIPISLCVVALLSSFGFWGASSVSAASQKNRLIRLFSDNQINIISDSVSVINPNLKRKTAAEITSILDFFASRNELRKLHDVFEISPQKDSLFFTLSEREKETKLLERVRVPYTYWRNPSYDENDTLPVSNEYVYTFTLNQSPIEIIETSGYDFIMPYWTCQLVPPEGVLQSFIFRGKKLSTKLCDNKLSFSLDGKKAELDMQTFYNSQLKPTQEQSSAMPAENMTAIISHPDLEIKILFKQIIIQFLDRKSEVGKVQYAEFQLLLKEKK